MDSLNKWKITCLAALTIEDVEDLYLFGFMITGQVLIGLCLGLVYRQIRKTTAAVRSPDQLAVMIQELGRAVSTQTLAISQMRRDFGKHLGDAYCHAAEDDRCEGSETSEQPGSRWWLLVLNHNMLLNGMWPPLCLAITVARAPFLSPGSMLCFWAWYLSPPLSS